MRVTPETFVQRECLTAIVRFEKCRGRYAHIERVIIRAGSDLPYILERFFASLWHLDPHLFRRIPRLTHICTFRQFRPKMPTRRRCPQVVPTLAVVVKCRVNGTSRKMRTGHVPLTVACGTLKDKQPFGGSNQ